MEKKMPPIPGNKKCILCVFLAVGLVAAMGAACSRTAGTGTPVSFQNLDTAAAFRLVQDSQGQPDFVILDVRTQSEYNEGHIAGATLIDFYSQDFRDRLTRLDKEKRYFVYCRSGNRSSQAASTMTGLGFRRVFNLNAGIIDWTKAGYALVK